jgi:hypothetical protein
MTGVKPDHDEKRDAQVAVNGIWYDVMWKKDFRLLHPMDPVAPIGDSGC